MGDLCKLPDEALGSPEGHCCWGGCGGRLHCICGEVQDPDGDSDMYRICNSCATEERRRLHPSRIYPRRAKRERAAFFHHQARRRKKTTATVAMEEGNPSDDDELELDGSGEIERAGDGRDDGAAAVLGDVLDFWPA